jgi:hypothetical protein
MEVSRSDIRGTNKIISYEMDGPEDEDKAENAGSEHDNVSSECET